MKSYQCSILWVHRAIESPYNQQLSFANEPKTYTHTHNCVFFVSFVLGKHKQQTQPTSSRHPHKSSSVWQKALAALSTCTPAEVWSPDTCSEVPQGPQTRGSTTDPSSALGSWAQTVFEKHVPNWTHFLSSDWIIIIINSFIHSLTHMMLLLQQTF